MLQAALFEHMNNNFQFLETSKWSRKFEREKHFRVLNAESFKKVRKVQRFITFLTCPSTSSFIIHHGNQVINDIPPVPLKISNLSIKADTQLTELMVQNKRIHTTTYEDHARKDNGLQSEKQVVSKIDSGDQFKEKRVDKFMDTIILMGIVGHGKSTIMNKICGAEFASGMFSTSCTLKLQRGKALMHDIQVIDTPGFGSANDIGRHISEQVSALEDNIVSGLYVVVKFGRDDEINNSITKVMDFVGTDDIRIMISCIDSSDDRTSSNAERLKRRMNFLSGIPTINMLLTGLDTTKEEILDFINATLHKPVKLKVSKEQKAYALKHSIGPRKYYMDIKIICEKISLVIESCKCLTADWQGRVAYLVRDALCRSAKAIFVDGWKSIQFKAANDLTPEDKNRLRERFCNAANPLMQELEHLVTSSSPQLKLYTPKHSLQICATVVPSGKQPWAINFCVDDKNDIPLSEVLTAVEEAIRRRKQQWAWDASNVCATAGFRCNRITRAFTSNILSQKASMCTNESQTGSKGLWSSSSGGPLPTQKDVALENKSSKKYAHIYNKHDTAYDFDCEGLVQSSQGVAWFEKLPVTDGIETILLNCPYDYHTYVRGHTLKASNQCEHCFGPWNVTSSSHSAVAQVCATNTSQRASLQTNNVQVQSRILSRSPPATEESLTVTNVRTGTAQAHIYNNLYDRVRLVQSTQGPAWFTRSPGIEIRLLSQRPYVNYTQYRYRSSNARTSNDRYCTVAIKRPMKVRDTNKSRRANLRTNRDLTKNQDGFGRETEQNFGSTDVMASSDRVYATTTSQSATSSRTRANNEIQANLNTRASYWRLRSRARQGTNMTCLYSNLDVNGNDSENLVQSNQRAVWVAKSLDMETSCNLNRPY